MRIYTGSDGSWLNELPPGLGWIMTQNHKCHLSRSSGGVERKAGDFYVSNLGYNEIASGFSALKHVFSVLQHDFGAEYPIF